MKLYLKRSLIETDALCAIPSRIATNIFSILVTVLKIDKLYCDLYYSTNLFRFCSRHALLNRA